MPFTIDTAFKKRQRDILALAWPMILSNLSIPLFGIVDTAILGHLPNPQYLAAVAIGSTILTYLFWAFGFLRMGTTALVAQAFGAGQHQRNNQLLVQSCGLAVLIGMALIIFHPLLLRLLIQLMAPPLEIAQIALDYCSIRIWSAPAVLMTYALIGWFIGLQNTRAPLLILLTANAANIFLDWLFIIQLDQASNGAAKASALADYIGLTVALILARLKLAGFATDFWQALKNVSAYPELIRINRFLFVRTALLLFVITFMVSQGAQLGDSVIGANAILLQLLALTAYALDGFAHAAEALVGKSYGQKDRLALQRYCWQTSFWAIFSASLITLVFLVFQTPIILGFTAIDSIIEILQEHYYWIILLPLISALSYQLDGIFIGLNRPRDMQNSMLFSVMLIFLPLWWFTRQWDNHGLWFSFCVFNAFRGLTLLFLLNRFFQTKLNHAD